MSQRLIILTDDPLKSTMLAGYSSTERVAMFQEVRGDNLIPVTIEPNITNSGAGPGDQLFLSDYVAADIYSFAVGSADQPPESGTFKLTVGGSNTGLTLLAFDIDAATLQVPLSAAMVAAGYSACTVTALGSFTFRVDADAVGLVPMGVIVSDARKLVPTCDVVITEIRLGSVSDFYQYFITIREAPVVLSNLSTALAAIAISNVVTQAMDATHDAVNTVTFNLDPIGGTFSLSAYCLGVTASLGVISATATAAQLQALLENGKNTGLVGNVSVSKTGSNFVVQFINSAAPKPILGSTIANPTIIYCPAHGYPDGLTVTHSGTNSTPNTDGNRVATFVDADHYSVPVNVTGAGTTGVSRDSTSPLLSVVDISLIGPQGVTGVVNFNTINLYVKSLQESGESFADLYFAVFRYRNGGRFCIYGPLPITIFKDILDINSLVAIAFPTWTTAQALNYLVNSGPALGITGLTGGGATKLDGQGTNGLPWGRIVFVDDATYPTGWWLSEHGTAVTDLTTGIIRPTDYIAVTNETNWRKIG